MLERFEKSSELLEKPENITPDIVFNDDAVKAFLKNAKLVILDEATAFADPENEHVIQASFKKLSKNKATLMIAHRLSTVVNADKILVIQGGQIAEEGKHEELLAKKGIYKKLWDEYQSSINWKLGGQNG